MSMIDVFGLAILAILILSTPFVYRGVKRVGVGGDRRRFLNEYLKHVPKRERDMIRMYEKEMIVWFEAPCIERFMRKAKRLRKLLAKQGRKRSEARAIWMFMLERQPWEAVHKDAETFLTLYDKRQTAEE